jgi:hypothetical protein
MPEATLRWIRNSPVSLVEASGALPQELFLRSSTSGTLPLDKGNADDIPYTSFRVTTLSMNITTRAKQDRI